LEGQILPSANSDGFFYALLRRTLPKLRNETQACVDSLPRSRQASLRRRWAQPIQVNNVGLEIAETRYFLNADFHLDLTAPLLEALNSGVSLGFLVEFQLTRRRWYWFDEKTAPKSWSCGFLSPAGATVPAIERDAASELPHARRGAGGTRQGHGWPVLGQDQVDNGRAYVAAVRLRLDPAQLQRRSA